MPMSPEIHHGKLTTPTKFRGRMVACATCALNVIIMMSPTRSRSVLGRQYNMDGSKGRRLFSLRLLLLFTQSYRYVPFASGQQGKP